MATHIILVYRYGVLQFLNVSSHTCGACMWWWSCRMLDGLLHNCLLPDSGCIILEKLQVPVKDFPFKIKNA